MRDDLCVVHLLVRVGKELAERRRCYIRRIGVADGDADEFLFLFQFEVVQDVFDLFFVASGQNGRELVPAHAEAVIFTLFQKAGGNSVRGLDKKGVSGGVAVGVVDRFQIVDIKEENGTVFNYCTCPVSFTEENKKHEFNVDADGLNIIATYAVNADGKVFVNADYNGQTDIECYAQWITTSGQVYGGQKFTIPDGGCTIPAPKEKGLYLLRVVTDKDTRSFKFVINQ